MDGAGGVALLAIAAIEVVVLVAWLVWGLGSLPSKARVAFVYLVVAVAPWGLVWLLGFPESASNPLSYVLSLSTLMVVFVGFILPPVSQRVHRARGR